MYGSIEMKKKFAGHECVPVHAAGMDDSDSDRWP